MLAGGLKDIIEIQHPSLVRDAIGGQSQAWSTVWVGKAWVRFSSGSRREVNGEILNTVTKKVTIRHQSGIDLKDRIIVNGHKYRILSMDENKSDRSITFITELINE